jgi:hypothetical protein
MLYGMFQSLIIARIGFSRLRAPSSTAKRTALAFASDSQAMEEEEPIDSAIDLTKGGCEMEMCTARSSTLA